MSIFAAILLIPLTYEHVTGPATFRPSHGESGDNIAIGLVKAKELAKRSVPISK